MKYPTSFIKEIKSEEGDFCGQSAGSAEATKEMQIKENYRGIQIVFPIIKAYQNGNSHYCQ